MLTPKQAFDNLTILVRKTSMTGEEHDALKESLMVVAGRCGVADRLEAAAKGTPPKKKSK